MVRKVFLMSTDTDFSSSVIGLGLRCKCHLFYKKGLGLQMVTHQDEMARGLEEKSEK